jgi:uridine kinase
MIGENITLKAEYLATANVLIHQMEAQRKDKAKFVIVICGESGSGKTVTAHCLQHLFELKGQKTALIHMDDYFHLPPQSNHENRLKGLENVGYQEVDLALLNKHALLFKSGEISVQKPVVEYQLNSILSESISFENIDILIVEGTYTFKIESADFKVFMSRNYIQTEEKRRLRNRGNEMNNPFNNLVLAKEHELIAPFGKNVDAVIDYNYQVIIPTHG